LQSRHNSLFLKESATSSALKYSYHQADYKTRKEKIQSCMDAAVNFFSVCNKPDDDYIFQRKHVADSLRNK
jgi:hypothetical protein